MRQTLFIMHSLSRAVQYILPMGVGYGGRKGPRTDDVGEAVDAGLVGLGRAARGVHGGRQADHADLGHRGRHRGVGHQHGLQVACKYTAVYFSGPACACRRLPLSLHQGMRSCLQKIYEQQSSTSGS